MRLSKPTSDSDSVSPVAPDRRKSISEFRVKWKRCEIRVLRGVNDPISLRRRILMRVREQDRITNPSEDHFRRDTWSEDLSYPQSILERGCRCVSVRQCSSRYSHGYTTHRQQYGGEYSKSQAYRCLALWDSHQMFETEKLELTTVKVHYSCQERANTVSC